MPTCANGHDVTDAAAFCHECGAPVPEPTPPHPHLYLYVATAAVVVIVLGLLGIVWTLTDPGASRVGQPQDPGISLCGRAPTQRPVSLAVVCGSGSTTLTNVTWSEWNAESAAGSGIYTLGGKDVPAAVVLSGVITTPAGPQFTRLAVTPQGGQPLLQSIAAYGASAAARSEPPRGGVPCPGDSVGIIGTHASCEFAVQVRKAYLAAGGRGQDLTVTATSTVTHRTYRDIACTGGVYVVCIGGTDDTARVYFGPVR